MSRKFMIGATSATGGGGGISGVNTLHLNDGILTQRAEVSDSVSLDTPTPTASIFFIVRQFSGTMTVFSKYQDGVERSWSMDIDPVSRKLSANIYVGGTLYTATQTGILSVDTWYQGAFSYDGSDLKLYINADLLATVEVLGPELVINGDFDTDTDWTKGIGWTITGGEAVATDLIVGEDLDQDSLTFEIGKTYEVIYTVGSVSQGSISFAAGGVDGTPRSGVGTFSQIFIAVSTSKFGFKRRFADFTGSIDNVSVKLAVADLDTSEAKVKIGARGANIVNEQPFIGDTALAIIYPTDILQAGITELLEPKDPSLYTAGMVLGLPLNFGSDTPETDTSGNGNNATLINGPDYTGVKLAIEQNNVIPPVITTHDTQIFNNLSAFTAVGSTNLGDQDSDMSFMCNFYSTTQGDWTGLVLADSGSNAAPFMGLRINADETVWAVVFTGSVDEKIEISPSSNEWHNVIMTYNGSSKIIELFLNGASQGTLVTTATFSTMQNVVFGKTYHSRTTGVQYYTGSMGPSASFSGILTAGDISELQTVKQLEEYSSSITTKLNVGLPLNDGVIDPYIDRATPANTITKIGTSGLTGQELEFST